MQKVYLALNMTSTIDLGFLNYAPRLQKTLLSGLIKYFKGGHYSMTAGNAYDEYDGYDYADWIYQVNDLVIFAFRRRRDDEGDLEQAFEIELRQYRCPSKIIWEGMFETEEERILEFEEEVKVVEDKMGVLVNKIVKEILQVLNNFNDMRKVPICGCCGDLGQDGKKFCKRCQEKRAYNKEVCSICLDEEEKLSVWVKLDKCGHIFHSCCISKLFQQDREPLKPCPLCRTEFYHSQKTIL